MRLSLIKDNNIFYWEPRNNFRPKLLQKCMDTMFACFVINNG